MTTDSTYVTDFLCTSSLWVSTKQYSRIQTLMLTSSAVLITNMVTYGFIVKMVGCHVLLMLIRRLHCDLGSSFCRKVNFRNTKRFKRKHIHCSQTLCMHTESQFCRLANLIIIFIIHSCLTSLHLYLQFFLNQSHREEKRVIFPQE